MRLALVVLVCCSSVGFAQSEKASPAPVPVQKVDFTERTIGGSRVQPVVEFTVLPERSIFKRMIQVRGSFAKELHESVDALR